MEGEAKHIHVTAHNTKVMCDRISPLPLPTGVFAIAATQTHYRRALIAQCVFDLNEFSSNLLLLFWAQFYIFNDLFTSKA